ncbi:endo alpha-1,4 polygalactosaminidase [uncultured Photobacterium sp.]|uniref:endo alpha-1,4 polygalactosaminidase n=1 Tax=uncultured Photobacterium sp. TaxID=173973 RepID=UPI00261749CD|nr:endo alpha-1,4 polygalactosaminidase [uncultured Photobacterium sp.]
MRFLLTTLLLLPMFVSAETPSSIAFYYGKIDSVRELMNYERVVVTPNLITAKQIDTLHQAETDIYAYLSIGEYGKQTLPPNLQSASLAKNTNWQSYAMNLSSPAWKRHLIDKASDTLAKGFDGLFLDTLDSYYLFADNEKQQQRQQRALTDIIKSLAELNNRPKLILNRGFEVIDNTAKRVEAIVAESLHHSYDPTTSSYQRVKPADTEWLKVQLDKVKSFGLEAIVIDYISASNREAQKAAAKRLINEGYTPYVSDGMLYEFGVSTVLPVPKRVLGFYDGQYHQLTESPCHRMMSMPLEYYGYVPECRDIQTTNFSAIDLSRYAATFLWLEDSSYQYNTYLQKWLNQAIDKHPILFINALPTDKTLHYKLGIDETGEITGKIEITKGRNWLANHYPAPFNQFDTYPQWTPRNSTVESLIEVKNEAGNTSSLLIKAPWGGAILSPLPVITLANELTVWLIDPFNLIEKTLSLPVIPVADATTESARRILTSHVDGDGFPSKSWFPGKPYTAEVLLKHVFSKYTLPQTVSVIEGEVGKRGLYPNESDDMEAIAREIFKLPNIEIASHTFSHPFFWDTNKTIKKKQYGDHIPIPGYKLDYDNEIIGSTNYINNNLAPSNKKVKLILWSGNADPKEDVLAIADKADLLNVNGGNTYVVHGDNNLAHISPTIAWHPSAVQVYAPVMNENLYTNLWSEHHDGYNRAVETFELLGSPRRLKSISLYYHMYSGAYPASLNGLIKVYDWALNQKVTPLYLSEYALRARTLYETGIAKTLNDRWQITSSGIRSVRLPRQLGFPYMNKSNIAGWDNGPDGKYLILNNARSAVSTSQSPDRNIRLKNANGQVINWEIDGKNVRWTLTSNVPLEFEVANASGCQLKTQDKLKRMAINNNDIRFKTEMAGTFSGSFVCPNTL